MATYTGHPVHPRWFPLEMDVDEINENMRRWNTLTKEHRARLLTSWQEAKMFRNAEDIKAFLHSAGRFVGGFMQHINGKINDFCDAHPNEMRTLVECLTLDSRVAQHKERYKEHA